MSEEPEILTAAEKKIYMASQWQLMFHRFRRHRIAVISGFVIILVYCVAAFCEFFSPYDPNRRYPEFIFVPPQRIRFIDASGKIHFRPFVYGLHQETNPETFRKTYSLETDKIYPLYFLVRGDSYKLWGIFSGNLHLFGAESKSSGRIFLFGTDSMGRDVASRIAYGARISMTVGLLGVTFSFILGIIVGGISGYFGGIIDVSIQRVIEVFRSFPSIPLWMALSAAVPPHWPQLRVYFVITIILSFMGWVTLARVVRGKFLSLREEEYVMAARTGGSNEFRIIFRHMLPSFMSHIIASITLSIPRMILGETALSFLGLGLRSPLISWGVLLKEAQNARTIVLHPWLLLPGLFVILTILAFNFVGDGLRDAADPYGN
jgi:peptide/nickel transport system permease protein